MPTLDDIRSRFPHLGLAFYAYDPGGDTVLEIHVPGGEIHTVSGPTEAICIEKAFPELAPAEEPDPFG